MAAGAFPRVGRQMPKECMFIIAANIIFVNKRPGQRRLRSGCAGAAKNLPPMGAAGWISRKDDQRLLNFKGLMLTLPNTR